MKGKVFEGGTRVPTFVHAPKLLPNGASRIYRGLHHATDWLPTLYSAAGGEVRDLGLLDGMDQWDAIKGLRPSRREEMLYNVAVDKKKGEVSGLR